jgi:hypothetical protein
VKRTLTWLFAAGLLAIAALYLASVIWPPPEEGGPGEGAYPLLARPGVTDPSKPDPAAATPYDILPSVDRIADPGVPAPAGMQELHVYVVDESGRGLAGSSLRLFRAGGGGEVAREGRGDSEGRIHLRDLAAGSYLIEADAPGFFPSSPRTVILPTGREEAETVMLAPGATIRVTVRDEFGRARVDGIMLLQEGNQGLTRVLRAAAGGLATSPALVGGAWQVGWLEHQYAELDSRLMTTVAAVPGQTTELWVTLPAAAAAPPVEGDAKHAVGISTAP